MLDVPERQAGEVPRVIVALDPASVILAAEAADR
jgi:hypothetical protein